MSFFEHRFLQYFQVLGASMVTLAGGITVGLILTSNSKILITVYTYLAILVGLGVLLSLIPVIIQPISGADQR